MTGLTTARMPWWPRARRRVGGRRGPRRVVMVAAMAAAVALLAGCAATGAPLPPQPTRVEVVMRDHAFDLDPQPPIPAGRVVFRARNAGDVAHELVVVDVADDPSAQSDEAEGGQVVPTLGVVNARPPGEGGAVAVDLAPGRYALICLVRDDEGVTHAEHGQRVDFEAR